MSYLREWPLLGAAVALIIAAGIVLAEVRVAEMRVHAQDAPPPVTPHEATVAIDRDSAFAEFRVRELGLPIVTTYPVPARK